ncbi:OLC1v1021942C1 [Oldenlandia corymbosa var. corymbosa]|uniref:OLC1v1021942C1 n=1 Tax=Oldenlandia corymbosa var. corymbosa TaxID=529605 RepID=A0AAV1BYH0_OLDCO|nr:OLC1v1021942C1 [Oldenlandia corymbosa var. corymbosa]
MGFPKSPILLLLHLVFTTAVLLPIATVHSEDPTSDLLSHLESLQSQSSSTNGGGGVIHLTDPLLKRILSLPTPRPFSFLIFFDAKQLHSKPELSLPALKSEFALVSKSYLSNNPSDFHSKLFFFDLEFQESQASFALFAVNSLPHIKLVPNAAVDVKKDSIQMDPSDFAGQAETMAAFVESRTKFPVGPIHRPPLISKKQLMFIIAIILIWTPFVVKRVIAGKTLLHNKSLWMSGAIFVYFFSVSGSMHNIIRKMPMFLTDRNDPGKLVFFYQGSGMQLGAEGFAVGFLYTVVGLVLAFVTHVLIYVKNRNAQRIMMVFVLFVSFWAVQKVVFLDNWKTGYGIHAYWPSSWK